MLPARIFIESHPHCPPPPLLLSLLALCLSAPPQHGPGQRPRRRAAPAAHAAGPRLAHQEHRVAVRRCRCTAGRQSRACGQSRRAGCVLSPVISYVPPDSFIIDWPPGCLPDLCLQMGGCVDGPPHNPGSRLHTGAAPTLLARTRHCCSLERKHSQMGVVLSIPSLMG